MLLFVVCLLPLVASLPLDGVADKYILDIDNGTLKNVRFAGDSVGELNLSNAGIRELDKNAFDNVLSVESLVLSDNSLTSLPDFAFSNLTGLKSLSLANNQISRVRNLFIGLENLERFNISGNPIHHFFRGDLFGLTKSTRIFTDANILWSISTGAFANSLLKNAEQVTQHAAPYENQEVAKKKQEKNEETVMNDGNEERTRETVDTTQKTHAKLCMSNGIVTSLANLQENEELVDGCVQVNIRQSTKTVDLHQREIRGFQSGWYQLTLSDVASLDLSNNEIAEISEEILNDLPENVKLVILTENKIRRIPSQVIRKVHPFELILNNNPIEVIEENAFADTKLTELYLNSSQLDNLDFIASLPDTLTVLVVTKTRVSTIPNGAFAKFDKLLYLELTNNHIEVLQNGVFRGLKSLDTLTLTENGLTTIEPAAFDDLPALRVLNLQNNSIHDLRNVTFAGLTALQELVLSHNKIARPTFTDLPDSLDNLNLMYNEIEVLERGDFVRAPTSTLFLENNKISRISRGAFDLPTLKRLHLVNNSLTTIDGDSYEGLGQLRNLWLSANQISEITKGACKNLGSLYVLDISRNPFEKLENGALHGLNTDFGSSLYVYENNLKEIQGGVFDDV
ncbi:hypothetical protein DMN91_009224 [Ooceraea biroi]|uniref:Leucine-rich repeats and immunoglobulin-like domains protein n=1 Tax=Ooceraea biroi TaxID=2015173 RepID=A0A026WRW1_OOCBI|nr:insulin-like growth factor-binding protein complex acid labile subunit [Ooceraea biroi]EZA58668.1 Leucine-rich repeats and immunoglobulin-like domains protein [Ooceraea biroi]RLU18866.1 hypothetical protein DMN91_009224 [Ooceraea biroi]